MMVALGTGGNNWPHTTFPYSHTFDYTLLESGASIVILGEPGSGKSTSVKKLALDYVDGAEEGTLIRFSGIPILVPLRSFARERARRGESYSLLSYLYDHAQGTLNVQCSEGFFEHYLEHGECLVCFDGLDEVTAPAQRQEVSEIVESFVWRYPYNRYVATSRIAGYGEAPLSNQVFSHYTIVPFADEDIQTYITKWYHVREKSPADEQQHTADLIGTIASSERLQDLARNPLLLAIIALIHRIEAELPHERVKLYEKCVEAILNTFEGAKKLSRQDTEKIYYRYRREILEAVAYWMQSEHHGRDVLVNRADLRLHVAGWLHNQPDFALPRLEAEQQAEAFIDLICERTGLLVERGDSQFNFVHLTFQEYMTAAFIRRNYILNIEDMWNVIAPRLFDANWREVVLLLLGQLSEFKGYASKVVESFLDIEDESEPILCRRLEVATACIADNIRLNTELQNRILDCWLKVLENPVCGEQRELAARALGQICKRSFAAGRLLYQLGNKSASEKLRVALAWVYYSERPLSPETENLLIGIVLDSSASRDMRVEVFALLSLPQQGAVVYELMKRSDDDLEVGASMLATEGYTIELENWVDQNTEGLAPTEFARLAKGHPLYAWVFTITGWHDAQGDVLTYLRTVSKPEPVLSRLLQTIPSTVHGVTDMAFRSALTSALISICLNSELLPYNADAIGCLQALDFAPNRLLELILVLDEQSDADDWNIERMEAVFLQLLSSPTQLPDAKVRKEQLVRDWTHKIAASSHASLKSAYIRALSREHGYRGQNLLLVSFPQHMDSLAFRNLLMWHALEHVPRLISEADARELVELAMHQDPPRYVIACALLHWIADDIIYYSEYCDLYFQPLLAQTHSSWARFHAVHHLWKAGYLDQSATEAHMLNIALDANSHPSLRLIAQKYAVDLGSTYDFAAVLRALIQDSDADDTSKNTAFNRLISSV